VIGFEIGKELCMVLELREKKLTFAIIEGDEINFFLANRKKSFYLPKLLGGFVFPPSTPKLSI
jgi:hypothetical protein